MNNRTAFCIGLIIVVVHFADVYHFEWYIAEFLGKKLIKLIDWLAFWRDL